MNETNETNHSTSIPLDESDAKQEASRVKAALDGAEVKKHRAEIFDEQQTFTDLGLRGSVLKGCEDAGFKHPTRTQAGFIPPILAGKDVLGQAKTGTGKTAGFGLPLLNNLERDKPFQALILAPTRELALQITTEINELGTHTPIKATTVYGGQAIRTQQKNLEASPAIIVGTPGRVMDMLERGHLHFNNIKHVVLDEVDRMLDIGFRDDIRKILEKIPGKRQTVFVSATISPEIERLARKYMTDPEKVIVASGSLTVSLVKQHYLAVNHWDKKRLLLHLLKNEEPALTVVFCRLKRHVDEIATGLTERGIDAYGLHGDMSQGARTKIMTRLREGSLAVLVASDLAARGIDVDGISHVINFDVPEDPEVYVHRIGRTARAGRQGVAWTLVAPDQGELLTDIEMLINTEIPRMDYPDFVARDTPPEGYRPPADSRGRSAGGLTIVGPEGKPPPPPQNKAANRLAETLRPTLPVASSEAGAPAVDASKFPGGIVPTKLPPRLLIRGIKGRGR